MRGKVNVAQFGTMTLPEYETAIVSFAKELDVEVTACGFFGWFEDSFQHFDEIGRILSLQH